MNRKSLGLVGIAAVVFAVGFWGGRKSVSAAGAAASQREAPVVISRVEKEPDMATRAIHIEDDGVTNRFRTLKAYYGFMRQKNPEMYARMKDSRRQYEERTFAADENRISALRKINQSQMSPEQRADIQTILEFNEVLNRAVDALNTGTKLNGEELNRRYHELYQVFAREKKRQVEAYGKALGVSHFAEMLETFDTLVPQQFFQRYWIVNEKLREKQEE